LDSSALAHELGHALLHRELYEWYGQSSVNDIIGWAELIRDFQNEADAFFEKQANEFAGRLLVPPDLLRKEYASIAGGIDWPALAEFPEDAIRDQLAKKIYRRFEVNAPVISKRLRIEKIYSPG